MSMEYCAGGIVFRDKNQVLLIRNYKPEKDVDYWGFPKGHLDPDETEQDAAVREVEEETNIKASIVSKIDDVTYLMGERDGEEAWKTVAFFRMAYVEGELKHQESELADAGWFDIDKARDQLKYDNDKVLLEKAVNLFDK